MGEEHSSDDVVERLEQMAFSKSEPFSEVEGIVEESGAEGLATLVLGIAATNKDLSDEDRNILHGIYNALVSDRRETYWCLKLERNGRGRPTTADERFHQMVRDGFIAHDVEMRSELLGPRQRRLAVSDVAEKWGVSKSAVYQAIKRRDARFMRMSENGKRPNSTIPKGRDKTGN